MKSQLPSVTFVIPVLNEEKRIKKCLDSIVKQKYDRDKLEILVVDGGSKDKTVEIVNNYGFKIIQNPYVLGDIGSNLGYEKAKGDLVVIMAADNVLVEEDWLLKMVKPFMEKRNVAGAFCRYDLDEKDKRYTKISLYINASTDPFNLFVYGRKYVYYPLLSKVFPTEVKGNGYTIYKFNVRNHPLIALAQGFVINKKLLDNKILEWWWGDDVLPVIKMIEEGYKIAYVEAASIKHYTFENLTHFMKKMERRLNTSVSLPKNTGVLGRWNYFNTWRKIKCLLFIFYALSFILPLFHTLLWMIKYKDKNYMFYHPLASFVLGFTLLKNSPKIIARMLKIKFG